MKHSRTFSTVVLCAVLLIAILSVDLGRWQALATARYFLLQGIANTFLYSIAGAGIGLAGGFVLAAARLYGNWPGRLATTLVVTIQALPALLIVMSCYYMLPELLGTRFSAEAAGVMAMGLISSTYYCEALRAAVAAVDPLQWDAGIITGIPRTTTIFRLILPQALPAAVPAIGTASIVVYKLSTLLYPLSIQDFFRASVLVNNHIIDPVLIYSLLTVFYFVTCKMLTSGVSRLSSFYIKKSGGWVAPPTVLSGA